MKAALAVLKGALLGILYLAGSAQKWNRRPPL
jgi:hypothetical protein